MFSKLLYCSEGLYNSETVLVELPDLFVIFSPPVTLICLFSILKNLWSDFRLICLKETVLICKSSLSTVTLQ